MAGSGTAGSTPGPAGPRLVGRFDDANPNAAQFAWSGSAMELAFTGTSVSVSLDGAPMIRFAVILDGQVSEFVTNGGMETILLGSGLDGGEHRVLVHRQSESFFWTSTFLGFKVEGGDYLPSTSPGRRLALVGDSISAGYGMDGCPFNSTTENHYDTATAVAARELDADLHTTAWSGIGMYRDSNGDTAEQTPQMPQRFLSVLPDDSVKWDFARYQPHAVLINLGTNDFANGDPGSAFTDAYIAFVTDLRDKYADALFYLAVGPMLNGAKYDRALGYLQEVVSVRAHLGDDRLKIIEFAPVMSSEGSACDSHPSKVTNARIAEQIVAALRTDLHW